MNQSQKLITLLLKESGGNITNLADALTKYAGRTIHRQQVQRWLKGGSMNMDTFTMLEGYQKFATAALKKRERDKRYRAKKKLS